jgi:hypothetical protein
MNSANDAMTARRTYSPIALPGVIDNDGPVRCVGPAVDMPEDWYRVRSVRTGLIYTTHASRFVQA